MHIYYCVCLIFKKKKFNKKIQALACKSADVACTEEDLDNNVWHIFKCFFYDTISWMEYSRLLEII